MQRQSSPVERWTIHWGPVKSIPTSSTLTATTTPPTATSTVWIAGYSYLRGCSPYGDSYA
jgi:hypothetical protein